MVHMRNELLKEACNLQKRSYRFLLLSIRSFQNSYLDEFLRLGVGFYNNPPGCWNGDFY